MSVEVTLQEDKKELVLIRPSVNEVSDLRYLEEVIKITYNSENATFTFYTLNGKLICIIHVQTEETLINLKEQVTKSFN